MSGALGQGMIPSPSIAQQQGMLLGQNHGGFMSNGPHMGPQQGLAQGPLGLPQNMQPNPPMGMLGSTVNPAPLQRFPMSSNQMQQAVQQQQRSMVPRQGPNPSQLNPTTANPSAAHMPSQMVGMPFASSMMQQVGQGNNQIRRMNSQPHINSLTPMPPSVPPNLMNQANQLRQLQQPGQQPHIQQQMRIHQQGGTMDMIQMRNQNPTASSMPSNMAPRPGPPQNQVMSSLTQPGSGMHQHQQNPFPNGVMPNQPSRPKSTQGMPAGPSHNPANRIRMNPEDSNSFIAFNGSQFPNNGVPPRGVAPSPGPSYSFPASSPIHLPDMRQPSPSNMGSSQATNHPGKPNFFQNAAQQRSEMVPLDVYSPSFTISPSIQRPPSHGNNPHPPTHPPSSMQQRQQRPPTPQHTGQISMDQHQSQPQRPLSQPSGSMGNLGGGPPQGPQQARIFPGGLTATGRIQQSTQGGHPGPLPPQPNSLPNAPRTPASGVLPSQGATSSMPPPTNLPPHGPNPQQQPQQSSVTSDAAQTPQGPPRPPSATHSPTMRAQNTPQPARGSISATSNTAPVNSSQIGPGQALLRLMQFSGLLAGENSKKYSLGFWNELIKEYFTPHATMKLTLWKDNLRHEAKHFDMGVPILPRFFLITSQSGVKSMTLCLDGARERHYNGHSVVECNTATWSYKYTNGYTVTLRGPLTVHVTVTATHPPGSHVPANSPPFSYKFDEFQFDAHFHDKSIALESIWGSKSIEHQLPLPATPMAMSAPSPSIINAFRSDEDKSWEEPRVMIEHGSIPGEPVNAFGIPQATMRCLELADGVTSMAELMNFSTKLIKSSKAGSTGPIDALKGFADRLRESGVVLPAPPIPPVQTAQPWPGASSPFPTQSSNTLYSSASSPHPPAPGVSSSPPNSGPSALSSPEKQPKTITQSSAASPALSTASSTPAMANASLKRKQLGDVASPTMTDQSGKRIPRKRGRTGTNG